MEKKKYTPGPWKAHKCDEPVGYAEYEIHWSDDGECVAEVVHGEADANLLAAAPELLEALENAERYMTEKGVSHEYPVMINAMAAIAKAHGKSN